MAHNPRLPDDSQEKEGQLRRVPDVQQNPESRGVLQILGQIPTRLRALIVLAALGSAVPAMQGCFGEDAVDTGSDQVLLSHQEGDWKFNMYRTGKAKVTDEHGENLYSYIKGILMEADALEDLSESDQLKLINAIIYFCRSLNPEDLDDFASINGKEIYFPESIYIVKPDAAYLLDLDFEIAEEKNKELKDGLGGGGDVEIRELNGKMDAALEDLAVQYKRNPDENVWGDLAAFDTLMNRTDAKDYHEILMEYHVAKPSEMKKFEGKTATDIQNQIDQLRAEGEGKNREKIKKLEPILKTKMYEELVEILKKLTPAQVREKRLLRGTVLDAAVPFYDLQQAWRYKKKARSQASDASFYDELLDELEGRSNSITLETWLADQEKACEYFNKHGVELGYNGQLAHYMTPSVIIAVMHAEFFSELSGRAFLDVLPVAIESGNLPFGPAVGDNYVSMGEVQLLQDTFEMFLTTKGSNLRSIQENDPSFKILVPEKKTVTIEKKIKKRKKTIITKEEVTKYTDEDVVAAMITDMPSHTFYTILAIAHHIELGFNRLMSDPNFQQAWNNAPESEKYLFIASFSASAINNGRGSAKHNNGAYGAASQLIDKVDSTALNAYIQALPDAAAESVPITKPSKRKTVSRGARKGAEAMEEMLRRAHVAPERPKAPEAPATPEAPVEPVPVPPEAPKDRARVALYARSYQPLLDRAAADGLHFSSDPEKNEKIYDRAVQSSIQVPSSGEGYRFKEGEPIDARMHPVAYEVLKSIAREFKARSGGYSLVVTDLLRSPAQQDAISISKGTHPGGYSLDIADGRFFDSNGNEVTYSVKVKGRWQPGPNAELITKTLRPLLVQILEEYQGAGYMMVYDESESGARARHPEKADPRSGGHFHVSVTASNRGPVGPVIE